MFPLPFMGALYLNNDLKSTYPQLNIIFTNKKHDENASRYLKRTRACTTNRHDCSGFASKWSPRNNRSRLSFPNSTISDVSKQTHTHKHTKESDRRGAKPAITQTGNRNGAAAAAEIHWVETESVDDDQLLKGKGLLWHSCWHCDTEDWRRGSLVTLVTD